ncbi:hypothetical protein WICMUC_002106 [Wickerhamomyces mucosus]|uniref:Uncharacterized protein n=1 Tax=Wickerhamomyces mucosus TaxID=1378264 RepID=A0A9P8TF53_9ASCO|nr:hypothetical protein WICMUC_002106 [Wickerhamomyces mucosus]
MFKSILSTLLQFSNSREIQKTSNEVNDDQLISNHKKIIAILSDPDNGDITNETGDGFIDVEIRELKFNEVVRIGNVQNNNNDNNNDIDEIPVLTEGDLGNDLSDSQMANTFIKFSQKHAASKSKVSNIGNLLAPKSTDNTFKSTSGSNKRRNKLNGLGKESNNQLKDNKFVESNLSKDDFIFEKNSKPTATTRTSSDSLIYLTSIDHFKELTRVSRGKKISKKRYNH